MQRYMRRAVHKIDSLKYIHQNHFIGKEKLLCMLIGSLVSRDFYHMLLVQQCVFSIRH